MSTTGRDFAAEEARRNDRLRELGYSVGKHTRTISPLARNGRVRKADPPSQAECYGLNSACPRCAPNRYRGRHRGRARRQR